MTTFNTEVINNKSGFLELLKTQDIGRADIVVQEVKLLSVALTSQIWALIQALVPLLPI